jgi:hypothetical protein
VFPLSRATLSELSLAILAAAMLLHAPVARCEGPDEYHIKAAYLLNFLRFTEWPNPGPDKSALVIGILGADPFGDVLESTMAGKTVRGRPISVRRFRTIHDIDDCQLLFVSTSEASRLRLDLERLPDLSILTVSENAGFLESGGAVSFVIADNKVRFDVNLDALSAAHLKLDAQLLAVARNVRGKAR